MKDGRRTLALLLLVTIMSVSCGTEETSPAESDPSVPLDGAWVLVAGTVDGIDLPLDDRYRVTMTIGGDGIGGQAACNSYGGAVSIDGDSFAVGEIAQTEMACEPAVMDIEFAFLEGLTRATAAVRAGDTITITGEGVRFEFALLPPVPTAELLGVTWVLDTIVEGDTATSSAPGAEPATLLLDPNGTLTGSTGCRALSGEYVVSGDTIRFTSFGAEGNCPAELTWQDERVVTVLGDGFTAVVEGDRLTISASGGEALSYTADQ